ncbi:MAG TPA: family 43 glycosylhydrolase [Mobilitalea sp.]|nr:family 43 glycosylhydrolase [Mobilitalea sp.]
MKLNSYVLCYTREPQEDAIYSGKLALSMHLAYSEDGVNFEALNHNSGVLFAKATDNENGTMNAKSLKRPYLFKMEDGSFGVLAIRTEAYGEDDTQSKGKVLFFTSDDLLQYREIGLINLHADSFLKDVTCNYDEEQKVYTLCWCDESAQWYKNDIADLYSLDCKTKSIKTEAMIIEAMKIEAAVEIKKVVADIEGIVPRNSISINEKIGGRLKLRLSTPFHVSIEAPMEIEAASLRELKSVKVKAIYNDGTTSFKTVDWNAAQVDWNKPGIYEITGTVHQDHYEFPFAINRADPCAAKWKDKYYFIATNDADGNHTLYIREADSIPELVNAKEELILDSSTYEGIGGLLWAPEFHVIGDDLYIFHAATPGEFFHEESHVMKLKRGGNPACKEDWSRPLRVLKKDGSYLCEAGKTISLDMTCFEWNKEYYVAWSERQFVPVDLGAWVYLAKVDPTEPWKLISDPVLLTKPDYGWANNHTFVDEGPFALITDKKLFLTFSSAAVDTTYVVGLLTAEPGADLLDVKNWTKVNYPLLTSRNVPGEYGPGHNSYVTDDDGLIWNAYHARPGVDAPRCSGLRRVHFDIDGYPVLDLTQERDLNPELKIVTTKLIIK